MLTLTGTGRLRSVSGPTTSTADSSYRSPDITDISNPIHTEGERCYKRRRLELTVYVVPEPNPFSVDLRRVAQAKHHLALTGCHDTARPEEPISGMEYRVQHRLIEQGVTHPLGDDNIYLLDVIGKR